jgi:outer membrane protein OmpA-like peptidoglycan-associated protein
MDALPAAAPKAAPGVAWGLGAGVRLHRPHDGGAAALLAAAPWASADALVVQTGPNTRPGFAVAVGVAVPVGEARALWLGPFVRYFQIVTHARPGVDARDARLVSVGLSLEWGSGAPPPLAVATAAAAADLGAEPAEVVPGDADGDGVPDDQDQCPDVAGLPANRGCPLYQQVRVTHDHLELSERLYFARDQAVLERRSYAVLADVARALHDHAGLQVSVLGHADATGNERHNVLLSERRAAVVRAHLISLGVSEDRLVSRGFGSARPIDSNESDEGRERNRRVEFVVDDTSADEGTR